MEISINNTRVAINKQSRLFQINQIKKKLVTNLIIFMKNRLFL